MNPRPLNPSSPDPTYQWANVKSFGAWQDDFADALNAGVALINKSSPAYGTLYVPPATYRVKKNCTVPENVRLVIDNGAVINVDSGYTLTVQGMYTGGGSFGGSGTVSFKNLQDIDIRDFGIKTNDSSNVYTSELNRAIAQANAVVNGSGTTARGAVIQFPPSYVVVDATLTAPTNGVRFLGKNWRWGSSFWSASTIKFTGTTTPLFDLGSSGNSDIMFEKLTLAGSTGSTSGANLNNHAIYAASANTLRLIDMNIHGWGGSALRIDAGNDAYVQHLQATGCLYGYGSLAAPTGVVHFGGGEAVMEHSNINGVFAFTTGNYTSGHYAAVYVNAAPFRFEKVVAAFAEVGVHVGTSVGTSPSFIANSRAEFNQGHGWWIEGGHLHFTNCDAYTNSLAADNTYDGFYTVRASPGFVIHNTYSACVVDGANTGGNTNNQRYGFTDQNNGAGNLFVNANRYDAACFVGGHVQTAAFNPTFGVCIPIISRQNRHQALTGSTTTTTFDGEDGNLFVLTCASGQATQITATNLLPGNEYELYIIQHATPGTVTLGTVFAKTATFTSPAAGKHLSGKFRSDGTSLYQIGSWSGDM